MKLRASFWFAVFILVAAATSFSQTEPQVRLGFAGRYKLGHWTPISIGGLASIDADQLIAAVPDDEGGIAEFTWPASAVQAGELRGSVRCGHPLGELRVGTASATGDVWATADLEPPPQMVLNSQQLVVVLGELNLSSSVRLLQRRPEEALEACNVTNSAELPDDWFAWQGVDLLIIPTGDLTFVESIAEPQWAAMIEWVRCGGRLILSVGTQAEQVFAADSSLSTFAPGKMTQLIRQRETGALENYAALSRRARGTRISLADEKGRFVGVPAVGFESVEGVVKSTDGRGASRVDWVIQRAFGLGVVTVVSTDLDVGPLAAWDGRAQLLAKLMRETLGGKQDDAGERDSKAVSHFGFNDVSGQLRTALEQFPGVRLVPFGVIGAIAVAFTLLIGPVDFLATGRDPQRSHWTWLSLVVVILGTTAGILWLADSWKGRGLRCNQVNLVDIDRSSGAVRGTNWSHVYVAEPSLVNGELRTSHAAAGWSTQDRLFSWHGLAGDGFGGMNSNATVGQSLPPYRIRFRITGDEVDSSVRDLLVPQWSSRRLAGLWNGEGPTPSSPSLKVTKRTGLLEGQVTNPLGIPLKSTYLCF
ncbi:MAG: hypothetical protein AAGF97_06000, partial [Planctomycetota bacterium]